MTHADTLLGAPTPPGESESAVPVLDVFAAWPLMAKTHKTKEGLPAFKSHHDKASGYDPNKIPVHQLPKPPPPPAVPDSMMKAWKQRREDVEMMRANKSEEMAKAEAQLQTELAMLNYK